MGLTEVYPTGMKKTAAADNIRDMAETAAAIRVIGETAEEWVSLDIFRQPILIRAAAMLAFAGFASGIFIVFSARHVIGPAGKNFTISIFYVLMLGGALWLSKNLNAKRAALIIAGAVLIQTWDMVFINLPRFTVFIIVLQLWLPVYWTWADSRTMEGLGLKKKGLPADFLVGLAASLVLAGYIAWGMKIYGFTFRIEPWKIMVNTARGFPMHLLIFSFIYVAWNNLKSKGLSPAGSLTVLTVLAACLNAPVFALGAVAAGLPPPMALAGFTASMVVMVLATHLTFGRFASALPAACLVTAMADLLLMGGII